MTTFAEQLRIGLEMADRMLVELEADRLRRDAAKRTADDEAKSYREWKAELDAEDRRRERREPRGFVLRSEYYGDRE